jgi:hypothetical protein
MHLLAVAVDALDYPFDPVSVEVFLEGQATPRILMGDRGRKSP